MGLHIGTQLWGEHEPFYEGIHSCILTNVPYLSALDTWESNWDPYYPYDFNFVENIIYVTVVVMHELPEDLGYIERHSAFVVTQTHVLVIHEFWVQSQYQQVRSHWIWVMHDDNYSHVDEAFYKNKNVRGMQGSITLSITQIKWTNVPY